MTLDETERGIRWLNQFPLIEREVGRQLLRSLRLVSHTAFESAISKVLEDLFGEFPKENFALFDVTELEAEEEAAETPRRKAGSSSDRIRHFNENLTRVHGRRIRAHPTVRSMRAERIKNVVLIEDFIGTGKRVSSYLRFTMKPSLKSWISFGWTKLWIVSYGGLEQGVRTLESKGYGLKQGHIRLATPAQPQAQYLSPLIHDFCATYAKRTHRKKIPMGFGGGGVATVFEHGCPNNAPVLLWSPGPKFKPLFPERGIPSELKPLFSQEDVNRPASVLWDRSQYRLALAMLHDPHRVRGQDSQWKLLLMLGLSSQAGWDDDRIASTLGVPVAEVSDRRPEAYRMSALDPQTHTLTVFGRALIDRIRAGSGKKKKPSLLPPGRPLEETYYPVSCGGLVRH